MNQGNTTQNWYCAERCFRSTCWGAIPSRGVRRGQIATLFAFFLAENGGAVLNNVDGHPEGPINLVIEVNRDVKNGHAQQHTAFFYFAQDSGTSIHDDDAPWYQIEDEEWRALRDDMERYKVCGLHCENHDLEHMFCIWKPKSNQTPTRI